jgi:hypothetical protein
MVKTERLLIGSLGASLMACSYNKRLMYDLRFVGLFCGENHKKFQLHSGAIAGRYRGVGLYI